MYEELSKALLNKAGILAQLRNNRARARAALHANDRVLGDARLRRQLELGFDVVVVKPFLMGEAGYYLAHK